MLAEYDPPGHDVHVVVVCEYLPASHGEHDEAPAELIFPGAHASQALFAVVDEYVPAAQSVQTFKDAVGEYFPIVQSVHPSTNKTHLVPAGQSVHPLLRSFGKEAMQDPQVLEPVVRAIFPF